MPIDRDIFRVETRKSCAGYGTGKTFIPLSHQNG